MINPFKKSIAGADIYIDLGTANTLVVALGKGLIVNEPSVVAYKDMNGKKKILAVGADAKEKMGRAPGNMVVTHPLVDGVIADLDVTETMLKYFLQKPGVVKFYKKPEVVISLPYGVTDVEKKACVQAGLSAGAKKVYLIDEPMASAVGAGLKVEEPKASMIIDIGGGTTEVAVISLCGIVHCEAVRVGGHAFDRDIVQYIKRTFNLIIGDQTAERVKLEVGTALLDREELKTNIKGVDAATGLPKSIEVTSKDISRAMNSSLTTIVDAVHKTLENIPPELVSDIIQEGIVLAGGGALIRDLDERLRREVKVPIQLATEPLLTIAKGGEKIIADREFLNKVMI